MRVQKAGFALCLLWMAGGYATAQEFRALLSGVVRDPSGSAIPGAAVNIRNVETNLSASAVSAGDGAYFIPQLPIGTYQLTVQAAGFKKYTRDGIRLSVGDRAIADVQLQVGDTSEAVTVNAELQGIESGQLALGQTLTSKEIVDVAIGGRNFINFIELSAGVLGHDSIRQTSVDASENTTGRDMDYKFHGGRSNANLYTLDGASNGLNGGASFAPLQDAIGEMKVSAPISDASYGLSGGGVVTISTKSGGNQVHGVLNEFFQNNVLNAWLTQTKTAAAQNPLLKYSKDRQNRFSGLGSGAIVKNKLFYAGTYEGSRTVSAVPTNVSVSTLVQRRGDFSQTFNAAGQRDVIYDPLTTQQSGNAFVRTAFPGNVIPASRLNAISQNILAMDPRSPNFVSQNSPVTNVNNYFIANNLGHASNQAFWAKGDYLWNEKQRTSASWFHASYTNYPTTFNGIQRPNPLLNANGDPARNQSQGAILDHVAVLSPSTVLTVRAAWNYWIQKIQGTTQWGFDGRKLGFTGPTGLEGIGLPVISFSGGPVAFGGVNANGVITAAGYSNSQNDLRPKTDYELSADLSRTKGRHFLRVGARTAQIREGSELRNAYLGSLSFTAAFTQANPQQADTTSGNSMASFVLGYPQAGSVANNSLLTFYMNQVSLYVQDDFRVSRRLSLNMGLRWDVQRAPHERFDRMDTGFDPNLSYKLGNATAKGSFLFAGQGPKTPFDTHYRDIAPRFGAAYQITRKLVFRGGAGLSYLPMAAYRSGTAVEDTGLTAGYTVNTPFVGTSGGGVNLFTPNLPGNATFANQYPNGFLQPTGPAQGSAAFVGTAITVRDRGYKSPYVVLFQGGFGYDLPMSTKLEASYVGSRTRRISVSSSLDYIPLDQRLLGVANPSYLTQAVPNPFFGAPELAGTGLAAATISRSQSLLPFPQFTGITQTAQPLGYSWWNGMEMRLNKRVNNGLTVLMVYTFAKAMEATSYREPQYNFLDREMSSWDRTHNLNFAVSYRVPVGRGRRFFSGMGPVLDRIAGNWQINTFVVYLNGMPLAMPDAIPARDPRLRRSDQSLLHYFDTCTLLTNGTRSGCIGNQPVTWVQLAPNQLRTYAVYSPNLRSPVAPRTNISVFKIIPMRERVRLEFRASAYNAFNNKIYGSPNTTLATATFGQVTLGTQANGARIGEFALRLLW